MENNNLVEFNDAKLVLKVKTSDETEKEFNSVGLLPEVEIEIKDLILRAESNYCEEVLIKTEMEAETENAKIEGNENKIVQECEEHIKSVSGNDDANITLKYDGEETSRTGEKGSRGHPTPISLPPMNDIRSPFFIDSIIFPVKYYQEHLADERLSPIEVLYELAFQCNWSKPEFTMTDHCKQKGFFYSVKINNHDLVAHKGGRSKKEARNLASARFLEFIGFKFSYEPLTKFERRSRIPAWTEEYSNFNSSFLAREEEGRDEFRYLKCYTDLEIDTDNFCYHEPQRSRSNESTDSKVRRTSSPDGKTGSDILKRKRSNDEGVVRPKSRRDISPVSSHRKSYPRMDYEEHRRPRLVHHRSADTRVYDCESSHSRRSRSRSDRHSSLSRSRSDRHSSRSRSRSDRDSRKHKRRTYSYHSDCGIP